MNDPYSLGQRWISDTETNLGLGTILDIEHRQITVLYMATGETRIYAKDTAPLTRVAFSNGDSITSHEGWVMKVHSVEEEEGLLCYIGMREDDNSPVVLPESQLNNFLQFQTPRDRLFAGLLDGTRWASLRRQVFEHRHRIAQSPIQGLVGCRVSILPHQLYIACEAAKRLHPRVLLADEVGLGKTIEAGMILHRQLVNNQVKRAMIVVPSALLHQWLVEMLRKFSLNFRIMDRDRFDELLPSSPDGNPFLIEQLVLCSADTLKDYDDISDAAIAAGWDMLICDEAHHLHWEPDNPSEIYSIVEALANRTPSVLLLTATPEQLGQAGHFARLRLLDPERFTELDSYLKEEAGFVWVADVTRRLHEDEALDDDQITQLEQRLNEQFTDVMKKTLQSSVALSASTIGQELIAKLIDRHGTGRLLFRNTRNAIKGFPTRQLQAHELEDTATAKTEWLVNFLENSFPEKILLICSAQETVLDLFEQLRLQGINAATFHEGMSIVERDRAAAWFADEDDGCRLLLCSEIGSEGRNFQFSHQLVTFDLPESPDLLEQRIGRLDRIGQLKDILIHVPYAKGSRDHALMRWYHEGLNAFEEIGKTGSGVKATLIDQFEAVLSSCDSELDEAALNTLIEQSKTTAETLKTELENGRDRLLELNSNRPDQIQVELDAFTRADRDFSLKDFLGAVFDRFGVNVDEQSDYWILHPGDHMQTESFPYLTDSGLSVTFEREVALRREDFTFLTWDHPMVTAAMDLILDEGYGQADCEVITDTNITKGLTLVEATYTLQCTADPALQIEHYLPSSSHTYYVGIDGANYSELLLPSMVDAQRQRYDRNQLKGVVQKNRANIEPLIEKTVALAEAEVPEVVSDARIAIETEFDEERSRLVALQAINSTIRTDEIEALDQRRASLLKALEGTHSRLAAVRVLFNQ